MGTWVIAAAASVYLLAPTPSRTPPPPWELVVKEGTPAVQTIVTDGVAGICLDSNASSFSIQRRTDVDLSRTPILHVRWRVEALPPNADFRTKKDDQAAQFFVAFATPLRYRAINYIWDTRAPVGASGDYNLLWFVRIKTIVVTSGAADVGRWIDIRRNVRADYAALFGGSAPPVKGVRFQVNSQYTRSRAKGCIAAAYFTAE